MDYKDVIDFCQKHTLDTFSVFVGAGLSKVAGLPDWSELVKPIAKNLGIEIGDIPLPRILEYAYGQNKSQYSIFILDFKKNIIDSKPSVVHQLLTRLRINRIWTTNYDDLIEKAYAINSKPLTVITNDKQLSNADLKDQQLIKMHGSLSSVSDDYDNIVLTESQYENCEKGRELIFNLLKSDINNKSFLFLGVSFDDENMRKIWASIWDEKKAGKPSFLFTVPPTDSNDIKLFNLWKNDLSRYGIEVISLKDYREIEVFFKQLCTKIDGQIIAGIGTYNNNSYDEFCEKLGFAMAKNNYIYHTGGGKFVANAISKGIWKYYKGDISTNLDKVVYYYRENGGRTNPKKGKIIYSGIDQTAVRNVLFSSEKLCLVFGESEFGRNGMKEEIEIALNKGCDILSLPIVGELSKETYNDLLPHWKKILDRDDVYNKYLKLAELPNNNYDEYIQNVMDIINYYFEKRI